MPLLGPNVEKLKAKGDIEGLIKLLSHTKDEQVMFSASQALSEMGEVAVEPLISALEEIGIFAVLPLADIGKPAVGPLTAIVQDKDESPLIQMYARQALERIQEASDPSQAGDEEIEDLISTLIKGDKDMQAKAAAKLTTKGQAAAEPLRELTNHPNLRVQMLATLALSEIER